MTATFDTYQAPRTPTREDDEPWPIWAALMVFLNVVVIATMQFGLPGLVTVMAGAAIAMLGVLVLIVMG